MPSKNEVKLLGKMKSTGSTAWENLHRVTLSNLKVEINLQEKNELLPFQTIQSLSSNSNPEIRKKAFKSKLNSYNKISETSMWAYNSIKGEQITEAELKGYTSVFHMAVNTYNLKELGDDLNSAAKKVFNENWIDSEPRANKRG